MNKHHRALGAALATAVATLVLAGAGIASANESKSGVVKIRCFGANACRGQSQCKTATNACKGQNACQGQGFELRGMGACTDRAGRA